VTSPSQGLSSTRGKSLGTRWGGIPFPTCTIIFSKFFACVDNFFFTTPLLEFYFFPKNCWRAGGEKIFQDIKIFSGQKKGSKKLSGLTTV
jgi:hypothetical protein